MAFSFAFAIDTYQRYLQPIFRVCDSLCQERSAAVLGFDVSVLGIDGTTRSIRVEPWMTVEELRLKLRQEIPGFYEVKLLLGTSELFNGSCAESGLSSGCQITAVKIPSPELAMTVVLNWQTCMQSWLHGSHLAKLETSFQSPPETDPLISALTFLSDLGSIEVQHSWTLYKMAVRRGSFCQKYGLSASTDTYLGEVIYHIAKCFGRTCDAGVFVPKLIKAIPRPGYKDTKTRLRCVLLIVFHEIFSRCIQDIPKEPLDAFVDIELSARLSGYGGYLDWNPHLDDGYSCCVSIKLTDAALIASRELSMLFQDAENLHRDPLVQAPAMNQQEEPELLAQDTGGLPKSGEANSTTCDTGKPTSLETSKQEGLLVEQAEFHEALMRSKADARNADGEHIVRLTSHSPTITAHLLSSPELQKRLEDVRNAGCDVCPEWANGAMLLVPKTQDQFLEAEIELQAHNIVLLDADLPILTQVLKQMSKRKRNNAEVKPEHQAHREARERAALGEFEVECTGQGISEPTTDDVMPSSSSCGLPDIEVQFEIVNAVLDMKALNSNFEISE